MARWPPSSARRAGADLFTVCSYCHAVTGEVEPYHQFLLSHGICASCVRSANAHGDIPFDSTASDFFRRLLDAAMTGDQGNCQVMLEEGIALGLRSSDLLVVALSGVLNDVGTRWEAGEITHFDEQRATSWCLALLGRLPVLENPHEQLDIVGMASLKNAHNVGLKLAEYAVRERGFSIESLPEDTDEDSILRFLQARGAKLFVISCALPTAVGAAIEKIARLHHGGYAGKVVLTGAAIRRMPDPGRSLGVTCAKTIWEILDMLSRY